MTKAWTKATGKNYVSQFFGTSVDAFNSLSFAPTMFYLHRKYDSRKRTDILWNQIFEAIQKKYPICTTTEELNVNLDIFEDKYNEKMLEESNYINIGFQSSNETNFIKGDSNKSFSVLEIYEYEETKILKIWTPNEEDVLNWNGVFGNDSEEWNDELVEFINFKKDKRNLYVTYEEYIKYFTWTFINRIENNFLYRTVKSYFSGLSNLGINQNIGKNEKELNIKSKFFY